MHNATRCHSCEGLPAATSPQRTRACKKANFSILRGVANGRVYLHLNSSGSRDPALQRHIYDILGHHTWVKAIGFNWLCLIVATSCQATLRSRDKKKRVLLLPCIAYTSSSDFTFLWSSSTLRWRLDYGRH